MGQENDRINATDNGKALLNGLRQIPPDFQHLKNELGSGNYTAEDVSMAATQYLDDCFYEQDYVSKSPDPIVIPGLHSTYVFDIVCLLLDFGLDPECNIRQLQYDAGTEIYRK